MTDLWEDEGFGSAGVPPDADGEDDWDEDDEGLESALEDGFADPEELEDDGLDDEAEE
jgi:hypothetical protein